MRRRLCVGVAAIEVEQESHFDLTETESVGWAHDTGHARTKRDAARAAKSASFSIDGDPFAVLQLETEAPGADAWIVDDCVAVGGPTDLERSRSERNTPFGRLTTRRWDDENDLHELTV